MSRRKSIIGRHGHALGFTVKGETVTGGYLRGRKAWHISGADEEGVDWPLTDSRNRSFPTAIEAEEYAQTLIDTEVTRRLRWW